MILRLLLLSPLFALCLSVPTNITIDDTDPSITYVGSWNHGINEGDSYGGGHASTGSAKAKATLIFNGTAIHYLSPLFSDPPDVSTLLTLDSNPAEWVNLSASKWTMYDIRWSKTGLTNGLHTLVISPGTSPSGQRATWGEVDGFIITQGGDDPSIGISQTSATLSSTSTPVPSLITIGVSSEFSDGRFSSVTGLTSSTLVSTSPSSVKWTSSSISESSSATVTSSPVPILIDDSPVTSSASIFNWPPAPSGQSSDVDISGAIQYSGNWTTGDDVCGTGPTMFTDSADASFTLSFQGSELFIRVVKFPGAGNLSLSINGGAAQVFNLNAPEITCGYISPQVSSLSRRSLAGRDSADAENQCTGKVIDPPVQLDGASYRREVSTGHTLQSRQYWILLIAIVCNGLVTVPFLELQ